MSARILVVEDEEALTTLLRYNLDAEGYDVETVGRGDDADTRLKERVPDLVVLDWMLPGLSGIEAFRRLRDSGEHLPVIFITGHGDIEMAVDVMKLGAVDFLGKPFRDQTLIDAVQAALRRNNRNAGQGPAVKEGMDELLYVWEGLEPQCRFCGRRSAYIDCG